MRSSILTGFFALLCSSLFLKSAGATSRPHLQVNSQVISRPLFLISDIDDTIKRTHVLSTGDLILNGPRTNNPFGGMNTLYTAWSCDPLYIPNKRAHQRCMETQALTRSESRLTAYVTGVPGKLQMISKMFLKNSLFPVGLFFGRESNQFDVSEEEMIANSQYAFFPKTLEFKIETIQNLMQQFSDHDFILIGDNGEKDIPAYGAVAKWSAMRFPEMRVHTFIHQIYNWREGVKPVGGQRLYVTAGDLAVEFHRNGWLGKEALGKILYETLALLKSDRTDVLPDWVDCRHFLRPEYFPPAPSDLERPLAVRAERLYAITTRFCSR